MGGCVSSMAEAPKDNGPTPMKLVLKIYVSDVPGLFGKDPTDQVKETLRQGLLPGIEKSTKGLVRKNGNKAVEMGWVNGELEVVGHILVESNKLIEQSKGAGTITNVAINVLDMVHKKDQMVAEQIQIAVEDTLGRDLNSKSCGWVSLNSCKVFDHDPTRPQPPIPYEKQQNQVQTDGHHNKENHQNQKENHNPGHHNKTDQHHDEHEQKGKHKEHHKHHSK